jgi:hypothetical protein
MHAVTLFPATLGRQLTESGRVTLRIEDLEYPAFAVFAGIEGAAMGRNLFNRFFELEPVDGAGVVARFGNDARTPAIVAAPSGSGRVAVFNTSADRDWSDWPTDPTFVLVMQEWTRHLAPRRASERNLVVGEPLRWKVRPGFRYTVVLPDGQEKAVDPFGEGDTAKREATFADTTQAGFYRVRETPAPGTTDRGQSSPPASSEAASSPATEPAAAERDHWFACRREASESDLEPVHEALLGTLLEETGVRFAIGQNIEVDSFEREQEGDVGRSLALGAGCLLLLELFAAWWFGRR